MAKFGNIIASLENLEQEMNTPDAEEGVVAEDTATAAAEVAGSAEQDVAGIDATDTAITDAEAAEDKVAELTDVAQQSLAGESESVPEGEIGQEGEGLDETGTAIVEITHESIMQSLGLPYSRTTYTSESFTDKKSKREATLEALGKLTESAKNIGNGIVAALKSALLTVVNFLQGLLKNRALFEKHLVNLQAKVKALDASGSPAKDKFSTAAAQLSVGGQASPDTALKILNDANKLTAYASSVSDAMAKGYAATMQAVQAVPADTVVVGNRTLIVAASENGVTLELKANEGEGAKEIAAPTVAQMDNILNVARGVLSKLREFEKTQSRLQNAVKNIISRLSQAYSAGRAKIASKEDAGTHKAAANEKLEARLARILMSKVGGSIPGAVFAAVKAAADYVVAGIKNYKSEGGEGGEGGSTAPTPSTSRDLAVV